MKEIIMTVDTNGKTSIETKGFKGKSCLQASKFIEDTLGTSKDIQFTDAYYEFDSNVMKKFLTNFVNQK